MPHDRESAVYLHPTCARNVAAIVALEHRTGMVAVVRPGEPAPRLERLRYGPTGVEDRAGRMFHLLQIGAPMHDHPDGWLDDAPLGPGSA